MTAASRSRRVRLEAVVWALILLAAQAQVWLGWNLGGVGEAPVGARAVRALLVLACVLPLTRRREHPLAVVAAICTAMVVQLLAVAAFLPFLGAMVPMAVANYTVAACARRGRGFGLLCVATTTATIFVIIPEERAQGEVLFSVFVLLGTWVAGDVVRARLGRADEVVRDVEARERMVTARAAAALVDERVRIARELHDVIAHSVSVMGVQAGAARTMLDHGDPVAAREAVLAIESTARSSVGELQRLLAVLRADTDVVADRAPVPGLAGLDRLLDRFRAAGLPVTSVREPLPALAPGVDLVAYRIIQESLTNALKHAAAPTAVTITHAGGRLRIEVVDEGPGALEESSSGGEGGHGLLGMRERVQLYRGTFSAGPQPGGGFAVRAELPLEEVPAVGIGESERPRIRERIR